MSRAALEAAPDDPALVYNYAMSLLLAGDRDGGAGSTRARRRARPSTRRAASGRKRWPCWPAIYLDEGDPEAALRRPRIACDSPIRCPTGTSRAGGRWRQLGRLYEARDAFGAAMPPAGTAPSTSSSTTKSRSGRRTTRSAGTLMREERFAEAEQWFELALRAHPPVPPLLVNRARCREAAGDIAAAGALFRAAVEEFGGEMPATEFVNFVFRHGSPDAGLAAVESALPAVGEQARRVFLGSAAALILRAGREAEAAALAARALGVAGDAAAGQATLAALADYYRMPNSTG